MCPCGHSCGYILPRFTHSNPFTAAVYDARDSNVGFNAGNPIACPA